jgi:NAD(P)H-dependent FMN reductase
VEGFVEDIAEAGVLLDHEVISLGNKKVSPCKGCWNCTRNKPCPLANDDLEEIKAKMVQCDMLILACPVYTNQVTAQMKALFDRLFTWCHIFPLLGKYSLSACTTGNDGYREVGQYLEKILATYGTSSFGTIHSIGGLTPGFFPWKDKARAKNKRFAGRVAQTILAGRSLPINAMQRRMYKVMKRKMSGAHIVNWMQDGPVEGQPVPNRLRMKIMQYFFKQVNLNASQLDKLARLAVFELDWWRTRSWLKTRSFKQLAAQPIPEDFSINERLLKAKAVTS